MAANGAKLEPAPNRNIFFPTFNKLWQVLLRGKQFHLFWEIIFAVFLAAWGAYYFAGYDRPKYALYILIGDDIPNTSELEVRDHLRSHAEGIRINNIEVEVRILDVPSKTPAAAIAKAQEILRSREALMVVGVFDSEPTEKSLPLYLHARPQIPFLAAVQTNDNLLRDCADCFEGEHPVPLLQMSPTNAEQARWAVKFAKDRSHDSRTRFLIVSDDGSPNKSYVKGLTEAYEKEIPPTDERVGALVSSVGSTLSGKPNWIFFAGDSGNAQKLLSAIAQETKAMARNDKVANVRKSATQPWAPVVLLSDAAVPEALTTVQYDRVVNLTDQSDASYYADANIPNAYALDSVTIAATMLREMDDRGYDLRFWLKWILLNRANAEDIRRNLVRNLRKDFEFDRSYRGADETGPLPGIPVAYSFDCPVNYAGSTVHRSDRADYCQRFGGIFHVWRWNPQCHVMSDVDSWHPARHMTDPSHCMVPSDEIAEDRGVDHGGNQLKRLQSTLRPGSNSAREH